MFRADDKLPFRQRMLNVELNGGAFSRSPARSSDRCLQRRERVIDPVDFYVSSRL